MVLEGEVGLGIALLLGAALAEYSKFRHKSEKGWNWLALGGVLLLFAGVTKLNAVPIQGLDVIIGSTGAITVLFQLAGWVTALIGAVFVAYETLLGSR